MPVIKGFFGKVLNGLLKVLELGKKAELFQVKQSSFRPLKGAEPGVLAGIALYLVQTYVPAGTLTGNGEIYVAGLVTAALVSVYNFVTHLGGSNGN